MRPSFDSFISELHTIQLEKDAGLGSLVKGTGNWLKNQYNQLSVAAGNASQGPHSISPLTSGPSPPVISTLKNYVSNKIPTPTKPPGPIVSKIQKGLNSKPGKILAAAVDQASNFAKLAQVSPYQQKTQYSCSAACLKAVLEHWGADRYAEHEIMHAIGVRDKGGAEVDEITAAAKKLGFEAYDKCFKSLDEAKTVTDQDIPIIADFQSFNNPGKGHYVVITKINDNTVHLMDPNTDGNERVITRSECEKRWWDRTMEAPHKLMPKWGIVVSLPKQEKLAAKLQHWAIFGGSIGATRGALSGYRPKHVFNDQTGKTDELSKKDRILKGIGGGLKQGLFGAVAGAQLGRAIHSATSPRYQTSKTPAPFSGVKSKQEAKSRFRGLARLIHPDNGGSEDAMKALNHIWDQYKKSSKFPKKS